MRKSTWSCRLYCDHISGKWNIEICNLKGDQINRIRSLPSPLGKQLAVSIILSISYQWMSLFTPFTPRSVTPRDDLKHCRRSSRPSLSIRTVSAADTGRRKKRGSEWVNERGVKQIIRRLAGSHIQQFIFCAGDFKKQTRTQQHLWDQTEKRERESELADIWMSFLRSWIVIPRYSVLCGDFLTS